MFELEVVVFKVRRKEIEATFDVLSWVNMFLLNSFARYGNKISGDRNSASSSPFEERESSV